MNSKTRKIGNSVGIIIPSAFLERLGLESDGGDDIVLDVEAGRLVVSPKDSVLGDEEFRKHYTEILKKYDGLFRRLADA